MNDMSRRSLFGLLGAGLVAATLGVSAASAEVVIYERAMPAMRVEVIPGPRVGMHWVPGHWAWRGGWVWIPGHHQRHAVRAMPAPIIEVFGVRPSPRHYWIKGHWTWSDRRRDWVWVKGHWTR